MRHRITELPPFRIVGKMGRIPLKYHGENPAIAEFCTTIPDGTEERLRELADVESFPGLLFVSTNFEEGREDGSRFDYYHCVATARPAASPPGDLDVLEVSASTWVVFEGESRDGRLMEALQNLWAESFSEWFPSNPYRIVPGPEILQVTELSEDWTSGKGELWVPVERV